MLSEGFALCNHVGTLKLGSLNQEVEWSKELLPCDKFYLLNIMCLVLETWTQQILLKVNCVVRLIRSHSQLYLTFVLKSRADCLNSNSQMTQTPT